MPGAMTGSLSEWSDSVLTTGLRLGAVTAVSGAWDVVRMKSGNNIFKSCAVEPVKYSG